MKCPKCKNKLEIVRETNWDNLNTYLYPKCDNCGWISMPVFNNKIQIEAYLEDLGVGGVVDAR